MSKGMAFIERWSAALRAVPFVYAALGATILAAAEPITLDCGDELFFRVSYEASTIARRNPDGTWEPELPAKVTPMTITWETKPIGELPAIETVIDRQTGRRSWRETSGGSGKSGASTCRLTTLTPKF